MKLFKNKYLSATVTGIMCAAVISLFFSRGWLETAEFKSLDYRFRHLPRESAESSPADIAIVVIDQSSIDNIYKTINQRWPWPREFYAKILGFLRQAGAKAVVFDMFFSEPDIDRVTISGEESDAALVAATRFTTNVFHSYVLQQYGLPPDAEEQAAVETKSIFPGTIESEEQLKLHTYRTGALPGAALTEAAAGIGFATVKSERDNICRRIQLAASFSNKTVICQSLAVGLKLQGSPATVLTPNHLKIGQRSIPADRTASAFLRWYRPPKGRQSPFPHYKAFNLLRAAIRLENGMPPEMDFNDFKDKIIYIGSTAPGLFDNWATPLAGAVPGVELQATALANLLRDDYIDRVSPIKVYALIFIFALITSLATGGGLRHHSTAMLVPPLLIIIIAGAGFTLLASHNIFIDIVPPALAVVSTFGLATIVNYVTERRHSRMVRGIFEHYLDHTVVDNLIANPDQVRLGGELRKCTVLFTDVANFTNTSEQLTPEQVVNFMNIYLNAMTDIIIEEGGFVDKFIGDEIIAIFGAPKSLPDHAECACRAALRMHGKTRQLQPQFSEAGCKTEIFARTGICTGEVVIGNMGSDTRMNYTAMGNTMNTGARIEGINKIYGTRTLVNEAAAKESGMRFREIDTVQAKGKERGERIFELLDDQSTPQAIIDDFHTALNLYREQNWSEAADKFGQLAESGDPAALVFLKRCNAYKTAPPKEWNGIYIMQTK